MWRIFESFPQREKGIEPVPLQVEHIATNRSRNHHSTHLASFSPLGSWDLGKPWKFFLSLDFEDGIKDKGNSI